MTYSAINTCKKYFLVPLSLFYSLVSLAQTDTSLSVPERNKVIYSFGIYMNNGIYLPEKIYEDYGLIKRVPKARYGYEFALNYNPVLYKGLGLSLDIILWGSIPDGYATTSNGKIKEDTVWFNSFVGDPTEARPSNGNGLPYWGFNFKINYTFSVCKHLVLQPEIGVKLPAMPAYSNEVTASFADSNQSRSVPYYYHSSDNLNNKRTFYPDLIGGINFLVYPTNPKHCIKIGFNFSYGFVPRLEGYYEVANIGKKYDSGGKVKYGSTHFGISIGYQFLGVKRNYWEQKKKDKLLFNTRY